MHRDLQPAASSPLPLPHLLTQSCPGSSITLPLLSIKQSLQSKHVLVCHQLGVSLRRLAAFLGAEELEKQNAISRPEKIQVLDTLRVDTFLVCSLLLQNDSSMITRHANKELMSHQ